jgi:2-amino-4-hydroxy-6-hydroxymethyldihydropteridine diphosphokinase
MIGYLGLGSNLGDRWAHLRHGVGALAGAGIEPLALSSVWETEPVGCNDSLWFLNMAVKFESPHEPLELLDALQRIERSAGRVRREVNAPRTLDMDLLVLGDVALSDPRLCLPHPRMWQRNFVLEPLFEIEPGLRNPATGRTVADERARPRSAGAVIKVGPLAPARAVTL